ncbi:MAG: YHS domain-containing protein, partial [Desulfobacterales bacterium]|nr:YHS domain-containing protein [Desulfobacterales bacterium]
MSAKRNTEKDQHIDPVCNMVVSSDSEYNTHYADKQYYFCSKHCLNKFKERPEQYLHKETPPSLETHGGLTAYTCPMHPEVVQDHPGACPKCGMALEPVTFAVEEKNEELIDMSRRFWVCTVLALPVFF